MPVQKESDYRSDGNGEMAGIIVGDKGHFSPRVDGKLADSAIINFRVDPGLQRSLEGTHHEVAQYIPMADQHFMPFIP